MVKDTTLATIGMYVGKFPTSIAFRSFVGVFPTSGCARSLQARIDTAPDEAKLMSDHPQPLPPALVLKAARRLLRPLVRLMMRSGVTFPVVADTLRRMFIEVALTDVLTEPKARTDSRISILTGVHRKEIKRLREMPQDAEGVPEVVTMASQIVGRWLGSPIFADESGRPRPLNRSGQSDGGLSFDMLVASITSDIRPRAVLDDLLSHGVVTVDADDRVHLNADAFLPRPGGEEQLFYFGRNLHDHVAAAAANIAAAETPPYLDRSVHYDGLTAHQAEALRGYAREVAMRALLEVNRKAIELTNGDAPATGSEPMRINFGIYVFEDADRTAGDIATP